MSNDRRNSYWDAVKGILIFLVVLGHYFQISISRLGGGYHLIEALLCSISCSICRCSCSFLASFRKM